jgi:putative DNA primase/helicase
MTDSGRLWAELTSVSIAAPPASITPGEREVAVCHPRPVRVDPVMRPSPAGASKPDLPAIADARDGALGNFPLTEQGTAQRLVAAHGDNLRFVVETGHWLVWDRDHWSWDRDVSHVRRLAANISAQIYAEGAKAPLAEGGNYVRWGRKCQTQSTINAIVSLASDQPEVRCSIDDVDGDLLLVGIAGGRYVVELDTGTCRPARRSDLVTRSLAVDAIGDPAKAERWSQFLNEVLQGDAELIDWVHRLLGYCLTGQTNEHLFLFAFGVGANGKTVFLNALQGLCGDYVRTAQPETLMAQVRSSSGPSPEIARLAGARLVIGSETDEERPLAEALIKQLTGGDRITARHLRAAPFEFTPRFKLILAGNHRPKITGTDNGIWRRVRLLPFSRVFAPHEQDRGLSAALVAEQNHIAAWLVQGAVAYRTRGLADVPEVIRAATAAYRRDEDVVGLWLKDRVDETGETSSAGLYADFGAWCGREGHRALSRQAFGRRLRERGLEARHTRNGAVYDGVSLRGVMV